VVVLLHEAIGTKEVAISMFLSQVSLKQNTCRFITCMKINITFALGSWLWCASQTWRGGSRRIKNSRPARLHDETLSQKKKKKRLVGDQYCFFAISPKRLRAFHVIDWKPIELIIFQDKHHDCLGKETSGGTVVTEPSLRVSAPLPLWGWKRSFWTSKVSLLRCEGEQNMLP
jgi:hypothetical protein